MARIRPAVMALFALLPVVAAAAPTPPSPAEAGAATMLEVTTDAAQGDGSLAAAITEANRAAGADIQQIVIQSGLDITVTDPLPRITHHTSIIGAPGDAGRPVLRAGHQRGSDALLRAVQGASLSIENLTLDGQQNSHAPNGIEIIGTPASAPPIRIRNVEMVGWYVYGVQLKNTAAEMEISGSNFATSAHTGSSGGIRFWKINAAATIIDSTFGAFPGSAVDAEYASQRASLRVEDSQFGELGDSAPQPSGSAIQVEDVDPDGSGSHHDQPFLTVRASAFAHVTPKSGTIRVGKCLWEGAPCVAIAQSSFIGGTGGEGPTLAFSDNVGGTGPRLRVENATFVGAREDRRSESAALPRPFYSDGTSQGQSAEFEHVTVIDQRMVLSASGGTGPTPRVSMSNTVIDSGSSPPLELVAATPGAVQATSSCFTTAPSELGEAATCVASTEQLALGALAANGNTVNSSLTALPSPSSVLIDAGRTVAGGPTVDQRGLPRPSGLAPDIGAVEVQAPPLDGGSVSIAADVSTTAGAPATFLLSRSGGADLAASVRVTTINGSAVSGVHFRPVDTVMRWEAGDTGTRELSVPTMAVPDLTVPVRFTVSLTEVSPGAVIGEGTRVGTIIPPSSPPLRPTLPTDPPGHLGPGGGPPHGNASLPQGAPSTAPAQPPRSTQADPAVTGGTHTAGIAVSGALAALLAGSALVFRGRRAEGPRH